MRQTTRLHSLLISQLFGSIAISALSAGALAEPRVLEESSKIVVPGPTDQLQLDLDMSGDWMIAATRRNFDDGTPIFKSEQFAYLYRRTAGQWTYVRTLAQARTPWETTVAWAVAIEGNTLVVKTTTLDVYENGASGWQRTAQLPVTDPDAFGRTGVEIQSGTILLDGPECSWEAFRKSAGTWTRVGVGNRTPATCRFGIAKIYGTAIAVGNPAAGSIGTPYESDIRIHNHYSSSIPSLQFTSPFGANDYYFGSQLSMVDQHSLWTTSYLRNGAHSFRYTLGTGWQFDASAVPLDVFNGYSDASYLDATGDFLAMGRTQDSLRGDTAGSASVFQRNAGGAYEEVARLVASDSQFGTGLGRQVKVQGRLVGVQGTNSIYLYDLPWDLSQPDRFHDTFESGSAPRWQPIAGSSFSVVNAGSSRVYRQASIADDAGGFVSEIDWKDQSIEADVRVRQFNGADRWFGLAVRRADAGNYYYVTARASGTIHLRRMLNGVFTTLTSTPFPIALDRPYRLRLEAIGTWIRVFADGELILQTQDTTIQHGQPGILMYKASADYDNVVVSPHPRFALYDDRGFVNDPNVWSHIDGTWEYNADLSIPLFYSQTSPAGNARAVTGIATGAQQVQGNIRVTAFGATNAWVGLMARFIDARNYYYVTLRRNGVISLRKLVNGTIHELDVATLPIETGMWYAVRLEAVGSAVRVYIDGELRLEATDTSHAAGRFGLVTYQAAADFDEVRAGAP